MIQNILGLLPIKTWKGIFGIRDSFEIQSGIWENAKIFDGLWKLTATREEGFAELLHGKEGGIRGRDYKSSWKRSRNAGSRNPLPDSGPWEYYLDSQPFIETKQQSQNLQTVHEWSLYNRDTQRRFPTKYIENTLKAIQSTLRSLEIHSNRRYIFASFGSSLYRANWAFSKLHGLQYYFPEYFRCNLTYYESEDFSDSSLHHLFQSENVWFPFSTEPNLKCGKIKLRKIDCTWMERSSRNF